MIILHDLFSVFMFAHASLVIAAAIYLLALGCGVLKPAVPTTTGDNTVPEGAATQPALGVRKQNRCTFVTRALMAGYVVVMAAFFWLAIFAAGAGHGTRIPLLIYSLLALPTSLMAIVRYALPPGSDPDIFAVVPLMLAPAANVGLFALYCRLRRRCDWRAASGFIRHSPVICDANTPPAKEPLAIAALILGCLALVLGPVSGVPAIICGHVASRRLRQHPELSGTGDATAGLFAGYVFSVAGTIGFIYYLRLIAHT